MYRPADQVLQDVIGLAQLYIEATQVAVPTCDQIVRILDREGLLERPKEGLVYFQHKTTPVLLEKDDCWKIRGCLNGVRDRLRGSKAWGGEDEMRWKRLTVLLNEAIRRLS